MEVKFFCKYMDNAFWSRCYTAILNWIFILDLIKFMFQRFFEILSDGMIREIIKKLIKNIIITTIEQSAKS